MRRQIFTEEHDAFRDMVRAFIAKEITPYHVQWERDGIVSRDVWLAAGRAGLLGIHLDEKYGGGGQPDYRFYVVLNEELARAGASGPMFQLHNDMIGPYLDRLCTPEQRERWFPGYCSGELIAAIAMTEPGAGSDLQGIRTTAVRHGDRYVLNGQKTFISNGQLADIVIVVARTDAEAGHRGISLLMVERGMPGFTRGRNLVKLGMHAQDTSELFFTDVEVPAANLLGEDGGGFVADDCCARFEEFFDGGFFAGLIGQHYGWRSSFIVFGGMGIVLGLVLTRFLIEPKRGAADGDLKGSQKRDPQCRNVSRTSARPAHARHALAAAQSRRGALA